MKRSLSLASALAFIFLSTLPAQAGRLEILTKMISKFKSSHEGSSVSRGSQLSGFARGTNSFIQNHKPFTRNRRERQEDDDKSKQKESLFDAGDVRGTKEFVPFSPANGKEGAVKLEEFSGQSRTTNILPRE